MDSKKIVLASDHAGYRLKNIISSHISINGHIVEDLGTDSVDPVDYPDFGHLAALELLKGNVDFGFIFCGTGIGISMAANKHAGIRAALCHSVETAMYARAHNNANILALGERIIEVELAKDCVSAFINTPFEGGRHINRINKINLPPIERLN